MKIVSVEPEDWRCGDGCCSDYWINIYLLENNKIISRRENLRDWGWKSDYEQEIKDWCIEEFDLQNEEFIWDF